MNTKKLARGIITLLLITVFYTHTNAQMWGAYTLYAPINNTQTYLVDTLGNTFKTWSSSSSHKTGFAAYLIPGDTLVRAVSKSGNSFNGGAITGEVQKVTWDGTVVWEYTHSSSTYCLHHDIRPMPNGNVLMTSYESKSSTEATNAGCSQGMTIWSEKLIEVKPTGLTSGTIVWEWHLWDHLCQDYSASKPNYVSNISDHPELMDINYNTSKDWIHMNGLDYNEALDQITFSSRTMNEIYVIDHSTTTAEAASHSGGNSGKGGDFLYRWGNPAAYGVSGTPENWNVVHDAHWISSDHPDYPNYLCGFNNGGVGGPGAKSTVDIISPPYNGSNYSYTIGQAMLPTTYAHRYTSTYTSNSNGASQQLPNGNMLICMSTSSRIYEITPNGTDIWSKVISGQPAKAFRYELCYVRGPVASADISAGQICEGEQITLNSSALSVTETNPTYTYNWESTATGFTSTSQNPTDMPSASTTYLLTITNTALGCSDTAHVSVMVNCSAISQFENEESPIIYPNPTSGIIEIAGSRSNKVIITNSLGTVLEVSENVSTMDLSRYPNGIYYISILSKDGSLSNQKIIMLK